jgi:protein-S-isoprenylcysteine O-methyltransferase Ste14
MRSTFAHARAPHHSLLVALLAVRAVMEERLLSGALDGYPAYAARVRFRLIPFVW